MRPAWSPRAPRLLVSVIALVIATAGLGGCGSSAPSNAAPRSAKVLVALPLTVRSGALAQLADLVADTRNTKFRHFRTIPEIATTYGASVPNVATDERILAHDGLSLALDPTHGAFWGSVTAEEAKRYFGTTLIESGDTIGPSGTPHAPAGLLGVTGVVGLVGSTSLPPGLNGGTAAPECPTKIPSRTSLAELFGFDRVINDGANGAGTDIDIVAVHSFQPAVMENYDRCTGGSVGPSGIAQSVVADTPSTGGGPEVSLDTLVLALLAPRTRINVARFDPVMPLAFPLMHLLQLGPPPNVLDVTVTYCESQVSSSELALSEWLLSAFAASGTTTAVASGDRGSTGCYPQTATSVTYPASSRFVVAIGGASFRGTAESPTDLSVWNQPKAYGGGGGVSAVVPAPPWQGTGERKLPDLSTYTVPGGVGSIPVCASSSVCAWQEIGGTSLGATVMGATGVLLEQAVGKNKVVRRWGNVAAAIWRKTKDTKGIADIVHGSNKTFSSACCEAKPGYDIASGWGLLRPDYLPGIVPRQTG